MQAKRCYQHPMALTIHAFAAATDPFVDGIHYTASNECLETQGSQWSPVPGREGCPAPPAQEAPASDMTCFFEVL